MDKLILIRRETYKWWRTQKPASKTRTEVSKKSMQELYDSCRKDNWDEVKKVRD